MFTQRTRRNRGRCWSSSRSTSTCWGTVAGVLGAEQGIAAALLEPAYHGLVLEPGDDQFAVELPGRLLLPWHRRPTRRRPRPGPSQSPLTNLTQRLSRCGQPIAATPARELSSDTESVLSAGCDSSIFASSRIAPMIHPAAKAVGRVDRVAQQWCAIFRIFPELRRLRSFFSFEELKGRPEQSADCHRRRRCRLAAMRSGLRCGTSVPRRAIAIRPQPM